MQKRKIKTYLGVDVGSLTIKFVLIDEKDNVLYSIYQKTEGKIIEAIKRELKRLKEWMENQDFEIEIAGVATTGSGRYLAGKILGADLTKNEITAHAKGVIHFVPEAKTIIDIGGQDSKIIVLENGTATDFAMNLLCVPKGTLIITENYLPKKIEEIKVGEKILTHLGRFREVEETFERNYSGQIIEIKNSNFKKIKLTPEHPVLSLRREKIKCYFSFSRQRIEVCRQFNGKKCKKRCAKWENFSWEPEFIPAKELKKGDFICTPLGIENEMEDPTSISYEEVKIPISYRERTAKVKIDRFDFKPELLRFLGYYLAEGAIQYNKARWEKDIKYPSTIHFSLNIQEREFAKDIKKIIEENFKEVKVRFFENPLTHSLIVNVYSKPLAEFVEYLCGKFAHQKALSPQLLSLPPELQKEILKGFFRGDGQLRKRSENAASLNKQGNRYTACTTSEKLAIQFYWLLLRNKIKCTLKKTKRKTKGGKWGFLFDIYGEDINKLLGKEIIKPKAKREKSFIFKSWLFEPILEIKKSKFEGKVYNLKVKDDNSYVANLFAVHNCSAGTGAFLEAQAFRLGVPVEKFGELALKSRNPTPIASRCSVFAESDMIHKQQIGHKIEDIVAGLCQGLARNYLSGVAKGKKIFPPVVFVGGVSENIGMRWAFKEALGFEVVVPKYNKVMGALGAALLAKEMNPKETKFRGFEISDKNIECTSFQCHGCPNQCEVIEARIEGKIVARWGDRCGRWSNSVVKYD